MRAAKRELFTLSDDGAVHLPGGRLIGRVVKAGHSLFQERDGWLAQSPNGAFGRGQHLSRDDAAYRLYSRWDRLRR